MRVAGRPDEPLILGAPALEDPRALDRRLAEGLAFLLAIYLLTATGTVFAALLLAHSPTRPVQVHAVEGLGAGDLDARLPEGRHDEFGDLVRAFNRMTRELRDAQDLRARAERMAAWREMARQIAHEIKNPLTPIKLTVQNLLATWRDDRASMEEDFERGANLILDQIGALHRIADAFSAYASFPSQRVQPIDVRALLEDVAALYAAATEAGEAAVVIEPPAVPLTVRADPDSMRRVLINLVTNARQAAARRIVLRGDAEEASVRRDVEGGGTGIPPAVLPRPYGPSFTTKPAGTGLGLPIVKRIVDEHRGSIEIESAVGRGTRVTIRLPRAAPGE